MLQRNGRTISVITRHPFFLFLVFIIVAALLLDAAVPKGTEQLFWPKIIKVFGMLHSFFR